MRKRIWFILKMIFRAILILTGLAVIMAACFTIVFINNTLTDAPDIQSIDFAPNGYATYIYDSDGEQLQKLVTSNSNRISISIKDIPLNMQNAIIAIEDERFYQHGGIDVRGIIRALLKGISRGFKFNQGASTITQQLLKNNVFTDWTKEATMYDRITRKVQEQYLAVQLEKNLNDKSLILENYLNTINFGAGTYGVQAAAMKYFNKSISSITLSEACVLAAIPQNPTKYNPITHPKYNSERRKIVLSKMRDQLMITESQYEAALKDDVYTRIKKAQTVKKSTDKYTFFIDALISQVVKDMMTQKGYSEERAYRMFYSGGLQIYTTQDSALQRACDIEFRNQSNFPKGTVYELDWALSILMDDNTQKHFSKEMLRNYFKKEDPDFDLYFESIEEGQSYIDKYKEHVVQGHKIVAERCTFSPQPQASMVLIDKAGYVRALIGGRENESAAMSANRATSLIQPSTTFIPFTYAEALEEGYLIGKKYEGTTIRKAIRKKDMEHVIYFTRLMSSQKLYDRLLKFGFTSLDKRFDIKSELSIGMTHRGVSNLEMTAAYATLANEGEYTEPVLYTKILDKDGNLFMSNIPEQHQAVSSDTAWMLTDMMRKKLDSKMPIALFVSETQKNNWVMGYSPYYTLGIWAGNENIEEEKEEYYIQLWKKIMTKLTNEQKVTDFKKPGTVRTLRLCTITDKIADACQDTYEDYVSLRTYRSSVCDECTPPLRLMSSENDEENEAESEEQMDEENSEENVETEENEASEEYEEYDDSSEYEGYDETNGSEEYEFIEYEEEYDESEVYEYDEYYDENDE